MKIWYDVSDVMAWKMPHLTGIQRTSVGILNGLRDAGAPLQLVRYDHRAGRFRGVTDADLPATIRRHLGLSAAEQRESEDVLPPTTAQAGPPAAGRKRRFRLSLRRFIGSDPRAEELRVAMRHFKAATKQLRKTAARWAGSRLGAGQAADAAPAPPPSIREPATGIDTGAAATAFFGPGDVLLSVGATWCMTGHPAAAALARSRGVRVVRMIYDLIPTLKPQWLEPQHTRQITHWARELLTNSDTVLTISEFSRGEIERYCRESRLAPPPVAVVRLGDVLDRSTVGDACAALPRFVPERPFFLCVSTLDVRKNHRLLYDAWTQLTARRGADCPDLVCVGTPHLHVTDLLREIRRDRAVNRHIHVLHGVEDSELAWYYAHCAATIYPSKYEGWGLPVAESLGKGRICLASNATSIPEISHLPEFFDPYDVHGLAALVERVLDDPAWVRSREEVIRAEFRPTTWRDTAEQVLEAVGTAGAGIRLAVWPEDETAPRRAAEPMRTKRAA